MRQLFLLGKTASRYSFSETYFTNKFKDTNIQDVSYQAVDLPSISFYPEWVAQQKQMLGFNVTIPYKESIVPYIDELDTAAKAIGAINTVKNIGGKTIGYNTDWIGFRDSLTPLLQTQHTKALILGTGGASKAIIYALDQLDISYTLANRQANTMTSLTYQEITPQTISAHSLIIQCTPVGTYPNITDCLDLPYDAITADHILYDLVYNPEQTVFMSRGIHQQATVKNGYDMLVGQAEAAWKIWSS